MIRSYLSMVRAASTIAADNTSIASLYAPRRTRIHLGFEMRTTINGQLQHNMGWAVTRAVKVGERLVGVPCEVALTVATTVAGAVIGTVGGAIGAGAAVARNAVTHRLPLGRAAHRGFVKGCAISTMTTVVPAGLLAGLGVMAGQAVAGAASAVALTLPIRAAGLVLDR